MGENNTHTALKSYGVINIVLHFALGKVEQTLSIKHGDVKIKVGFKATSLLTAMAMFRQITSFLLQVSMSWI